jgi:hypothetical protein
MVEMFWPLRVVAQTWARVNLTLGEHVYVSVIPAANWRKDTELRKGISHGVWQ